MDGNFSQISVAATCQTNNQFIPPDTWPVCKPSNALV